MARLLEECPPRAVKITLYGSNDQVYEQVCQVKEGFTRVDRGIQLLREMKIPVQLISTVIRQNEADVQKMAFYAFRNQLPWMATGGVKASVRTPNSEAREVRVQEKLDEQKKEEIRQRFKNAPVNIERKPCTYCKDYRLGYWVTWTGMMRFCSFMNEPDIPVLERAFPQAWKELIEYEEALEWPEECYVCEANKICFKCMGTLNSECGNVNYVTESFCEKYKSLWQQIREEL